MSEGELELLVENPSRIIFRDCKPGMCHGNSFSTLDTEMTEIFTLEGFKELLMWYLKQDRDFVIARVTTQDSSTKLMFYSYYSAIELNKILFCIEDNNLLYRTKARNPANNLRIVEEVLYYRITPEILKNTVNNPKNNVQGRYDGIVIEAEYFASDEDILFDGSVRKYFAMNFPEEKEYFQRRPELINGSPMVVDEGIENEDDKLSLKIILYTNIGTILVVFGMCMFLGSDEIFLTAIAPLTLTLFFSIFFLVLYVVLFETPDILTSILNLRKEEDV